jgi:hypothetical protein
MNAQANKDCSATATSNPDHKEPSAEASRRAVAILEVLAGQRTAGEAATALSISINHYYLLERKALVGLTAACELAPKGRQGAGLEKQLETVQRELEQCQRECLRQAALVRAAQRAVGLSAVPPPTAAKRAGGNGKSQTAKSKTRRRRPQVRALRAARQAQKNSSSSKTEAELSHPPETSQEASPPRNVKEHPDAAQG